MAKLKNSSIVSLKKVGYTNASLEDLLKEVSKGSAQFIGGTSVSNVWWIHLKDSNNNDLEGALVKEYIKKNGS